MLLLASCSTNRGITPANAAQQLNYITLNRAFGHVGGLSDFYLGSVSYSNGNYIIKFYFQSSYHYPNAKIDNIYVGNFRSVNIQDLTPGYLYKAYGQNKTFIVTVSGKYNILHLQGVGMSSRNFDINLRDFDQYFISKSPPQEKKLIDKSSPYIQVVSPELSQNIYRTEEPSLTIRGKTTDSEGIAYISINGKNARLKADGSFIARVKVKIGKSAVKIVSTDINDNTGKKEFIVIREEFIGEDEFSDVDFPNKTNNNNKNGVAIVLGVEDYQYAPTVTYAYNDADIFREYLISSFGFKRENIYFKTNNRATKGEFEKIFSQKGWLSNHINSKSDVIVFYAGHGAPDITTKETYLVPYDIDPNYATTGYSLDELYKGLGKLKAKSVTVILDACFSGGTRDNQPLLAGTRPINLSIESGNVPENITVFSAASGNEISSAYKQKNHGIFTYFFLKGLNGYADKDQDKIITMSEMQNYLGENVSMQAKKMGREQTPQLHGNDKNRVLLKY